MAKENIKFPRSHVAISDDYFYYCDERNNTLNVKVCNGDTVFSYPFEYSLGGRQVKSLEYDGRYFWTLQQGDSIDDSVIKKWYLDNYTCKLYDTIELNKTSNDVFRCKTFTLEFYNTTLSSNVESNQAQISINSYYDKITPGTILTLGPNKDGLYEDVTVTGTINSADELGLDFYTSNSYSEETPVYFATNLWLINDYTHLNFGGSLYKIKLSNNRIERVIEDSDFELVNSSCFYNSGVSQYILYVVGTTLRFFNAVTELNETSMLLDNRKTDNSEITIYDIKVKEDSLFRLQKAANYYNSDYSWETYNYQVATIRPFVDSVSVAANPTILPSNGINTSEITISVRDQYNNPIKYKPVLLTDDDATGFVTSGEVFTNLYGVAKAYYRAGIIPGSVSIQILATQYD